MGRKVPGSGTERDTARGRRQLRVTAIFGIASVMLKVAFPLLRRRVEKAFHDRCQQMVHDMEFGERPSCEMCYEMHRAMHRRIERETAATRA